MNKGRFFITVLASSAVLLSAATPALANNNKGHEKSHVTVVRGNVYDESKGGQGIGSLKVTVTCAENKNKSVSATDTTDRNGLYTVAFNSSQCKKYAPVSATVTYNGQAQTDTVYVSAQNTATMDFYFGVTNVPEFGLIPGLIATVSSVALSS